MEYIKTQSNNRIHKNCKITGSSNIQIQGNCVFERCNIDAKSDAPITIGKYCVLSDGVMLSSDSKGCVLGSYCLVGNNCQLVGCTIGSRVMIGDNCILQTGCVLRDCCVVDSGVVIPPKYVLAPFSHVTRTPSGQLQIRHLNEAHKHKIEMVARKKLVN